MSGLQEKAKTAESQIHATFEQITKTVVTMLKDRKVALINDLTKIKVQKEKELGRHKDELEYQLSDVRQNMLVVATASNDIEVVASHHRLAACITALSKERERAKVSEIEFHPGKFEVESIRSIVKKLGVVVVFLPDNQRQPPTAAEKPKFSLDNTIFFTAPAGEKRSGEFIIFTPESFSSQPQLPSSLPQQPSSQPQLPSTFPQQPSSLSQQSPSPSSGEKRKGMTTPPPPPLSLPPPLPLPTMTTRFINCLPSQIKQRGKRRTEGEDGLSLFELEKIKFSVEKEEAWVEVFKNQSTGKNRIVSRAEGSGRLLLNAALFPLMSVQRTEGKKDVIITTIGPEAKAVKYLLCCKSPEEAATLQEILNRYKVD